MRANFDGVVYGTRECAARLMPHGGSIVATASLAGLTGMPFDPMYTATKHAVVGFVRGAAPGLARRGIRLNALCPGFTDTPIVEDELRGRLPVPLMEPSFVAQAALQALNDEETGRRGSCSRTASSSSRSRTCRARDEPQQEARWGERASAAAHLADARLPQRLGRATARS